MLFLKEKKMMLQYCWRIWLQFYLKPLTIIVYKYLIHVCQYLGINLPEYTKPLIMAVSGEKSWGEQSIMKFSYFYNKKYLTYE